MEGDRLFAPPGVRDRATAPWPPAGQLSQIEAAKARLISSRDLCRNSDVLIRESRATIERSLERLNSAPEDPIALRLAAR